VDEKGAFKLLDVPEARHAQGVEQRPWVHEQAVEVTPKGVEILSRWFRRGQPRAHRTIEAEAMFFQNWFILVGLLAGVAVTAAFVAPRRPIVALSTEGQRLDRAQYAAEQMLKNDARR